MSTEATVVARRLPSVHRRGELAVFWRRLRRTRLAIPAALLVGGLVIVALFAPWLAPYDPIAQQPLAILYPPSAYYPLGADEIGRDVLSRVVWGARPALLVGLASVTLATIIGVPFGLLAGYFGGWCERLMRVMDAVQSFPGLVLALAITAVLGPSLLTVIIAIGIVFSPTYARLVRGQVLAIRELEFVTAARAIGLRELRIAIRHVLPQAMPPVIVQWALGLSVAILIEASLSFLGLGQRPPTPSWGGMLRTGYTYIDVAPWLSIAPGVAILLTVLAFNFLGDAIRDALDPRLNFGSK